MEQDLLVEVKEKPTAIVIKEFSQNGAKVQYNSMGEVKGRLSGSHIETTDIFQRMDGTYDWESRAIETTMDGDVVMISGKGTGKQAAGSTAGNFNGECTCMTMSPKLSWLNNMKVRVEGTFDSKNMETNIKSYQIKEVIASQPSM